MMADMGDKAHEAGTDPFSWHSDLASCVCVRSWLKMEVDMDGEDIVRVLLVGDNPQSFSLSRQLLESNGCECNFAGSVEAAENLLRLWQFDIVLSTHRVPSNVIQSLVGLLSGSGTSLFASLRVEEGLWWVPVLQFGKDCYGPALRVDEFARILDDLRRQLRIER
jgi:CheY-like chemotaxis protein